MGKKKKKSTAAQSEPETGSPAPAPKGAASRWQPAYARAQADDKPEPINWKTLATMGTAVLLLAFSTHIFTINVGMVLTDRSNLDYIFNPQKMQLIAIKDFDDLLHHPLMQPWTKTSFINDRTDYGQKVSWFHSANVVFHAAAAGYLFAFVFQLVRELKIQKRVTMSPYHAALGAGALFATHPFTSETVAYLSARAALLGTTNFFLSLDFLLLGMLTKNPWIAAGAYGLAAWSGCMSVWSCPEMVSLPAVAFFTALLVRGPLNQWKQSFTENKILLPILLLLAIAAPFAGLTGFEPATAINPGVPVLSTTAYLASQVKAIPLYYMRCFIAPLGLSIDPPMAVASTFTEPYVLAGIAIIAACSYAAWRWRSTTTGAGVLLLLAGFVPHAIFIQPDTVADWAAYLPLGGVAIIAGALFARRLETNAKGATAFFVTLVLSLAGLSVYRDSQWTSNLSLWSSALQVRPKSAVAHAMLAIEQTKRKRLEEADKLSSEAISLSPDLCIARVARATVMLATDRYNAAEEQLIAARNLAQTQKLPGHIMQDIKYGLVEAYLMQGQVQKAQGLLSELITADVMQRDGRAFRIAGLAAFKGRQYDMAIQRLVDAIKADPQLAQCWEMIALCALELGSGENAYTAATNYKEQLDSEAARLLLARAALASDKVEEGEALLLDLLKQNPKDAQAAYVLSRHYKRLGKQAEADKYKETATKLVPDIETKTSLPEMNRPLAKPPEKTSSPPAPEAPPPEPSKTSGQSNPDSQGNKSKSESESKSEAEKSSSAADDSAKPESAKPEPTPTSGTASGTTSNKETGASPATAPKGSDSKTGAAK